MENKIVDLETLTGDELLQEFADRVMDYEKSSTELHALEIERARSEECTDTVMDALGYRPDDNEDVFDEVDEEEEEKYQNLKLENDENFCRVRECIRFIKNDKTIWNC